MNLSLSVQACAKINLTLEVGDIRQDGYHDIESVAACVGLWDRIELEIRENSEGIDVYCPNTELPNGPANTVYLAADHFIRATELKIGVRARVNKEIPVQAGLGGGSSDAAAVLRALNKMIGNPLGPDELLCLGAAVGSDVPLFLVGGNVQISGRGELVEPLRDIPRFWAVIAQPEYGVSTREAYEALDAVPDRIWTGAADVAAAAIYEGDLNLITGAMWNDFEGPVFEMHPELRDLKIRLTDLGASGALLAGSGSAVYGLFGNRIEAENAWESILREGWRAWRVPILTREESTSL